MNEQQAGAELERPVMDMALIQATAETAAGVQAAMTQLLQMTRSMGAIRQQMEQVTGLAQDTAAEVGILRTKVEAQISLGSAASRKLQKAVGRKVKSLAHDREDCPRHFAQLYGGLKDYFDVASYVDIPRARFDEAMKLIERYDGSTRHWWR